MMRKGTTTMWDDFTDFELAELAGTYGLEEELMFSGDLTLVNRTDIEKLLTATEYDLAFQEEVAFNSEVEYN